MDVKDLNLKQRRYSNDATPFYEAQAYRNGSNDYIKGIQTDDWEKFEPFLQSLLNDASLSKIEIEVIARKYTTTTVTQDRKGSWQFDTEENNHGKTDSIGSAE